MFLTLLLVTLVVALATSGIVVLLFRRPIRQILDRTAEAAETLRNPQSALSRT